ncbi:substrate-binding periplasmic protein [Litorilituus sediminis]|nr:transporter substrate-binding domain-containing protein [Litorilituus sediminis]
MKRLFALILFYFSSTSTAIAAEEEIKVAVFLEPPFVDYIDNQWQGENIDMIKLLSQRVQLTPKFIRCPFARCLTMVKKGQADLIMGVMKSKERAEYLTFIEPPYLLQHKPLRFFTLANNNITINNIDDLTPLIVGTIRGASYHHEFDNNHSMKKVAITSREQLVKMLLKGHIDTFIEREESIKPLLSTQDYQQKLALANYLYDDPVGSYIAISKKTSIQRYAKPLAQQLHKMISSGEFQQIRAHYQLR